MEEDPIVGMTGTTGSTGASLSAPGHRQVCDLPRFADESRPQTDRKVTLQATNL